MNGKKIINAKVYTAEEDQPWAEAVAVLNGRIVTVGSTGEIQDLDIGPAETIDAGGRLVLPGFIDSHCHPTAYTYKANAADLFSCNSINEYQEALAGYAAQNPTQEVVKGVGWFYSDFGTGGPHKRDLDAVISDRPVMIYSGDLHALWVNTKALESAGIDRDTPDPYGGEFAKDENGEPTGYINESPAVKVIESRISSFGVNEYKKGIRTFFAHANEVGITSVRDAGILEECGLPAYKALLEDEYTVNVFCDCLLAPADISSPERLQDLLTPYLEAENGRFACAGVKMFMDGVPEANTAVLEEAYSNDPANYGEPQWQDLPLFNAVCAQADRLGWQIHVHAIGDRAVRYTVDALEYAARQNGRRDSRHLIAHLQLCSEKDVRRMAVLGAIAVPTAFWFEKGDLYYGVELLNLGKERADKEYRMKSFIDAGLMVACGSDAPVGIGVPVTKIPFAPLLAIQQGITRCCALKDPSDPENVLNPVERVTLEDMIRTYTINGAYANFAEDWIGSIKAGKEADLIVLDKDLFSIPVTEIHTANVLMTIYKGDIVYSNDLLF